MNKVILKEPNGRFFVRGKGFVAQNKNEATQFQSAEDAAKAVGCAAEFGIQAHMEEVLSISFGVVYIRRKDVTANGELDKQKADRALNEQDPSRRRFATFEEARIHGSRFHVRRAKRGDAPGTAGHRGFYIVETNDPVNAAVNPATGLTNPV
jgi:hypothetical protein